MIVTDPIATFHAPGAYSVSWHLTTNGTHVIVYGESRAEFTDSLRAGRGFGESVRHALECAGEFNNIEAA